MKAAVLGAGGMGSGVARLLSRQEAIDEVIAMDIDPEKVERLQGPGIVGTTDLDRVINDEAVKVCWVTASNDAHKPLTLAAIQAGKAVLCEKPMANRLADAEAMVEAAEKAGVFFQVGFELRYSTLYTTVTDWIEQGLLGDVINTHCLYICSEFHGKGSWRNQRHSGGGMFGEKLSHYVDLPRLWVGRPVVDVFSACAPNTVPYYQVRDNYHTTYRFEGGAVSHLTFIMHVGETFHGDPLQNVIDQQQDDGHELQYLVTGTKGAAATNVFRRSIRRWEFGDSPKSITSKLVEHRTWDPSRDGEHFHYVKGQTLDVLRRVQEGRPPKTPARDSLETMKLVFAAEKSADEGRIIRLDELVG